MHVSIGGKALCRPSSFTAGFNSADCQRCAGMLDKLLELLLRSVATHNEVDRAKAWQYAAKLGFDPAVYLPPNLQEEIIRATYVPQKGQT
jgi:hypothetical protein